ncbi:MAG: hypothetical protein E7773_10185 [Sphingomonas sp.]|uniref:hypothetical protein n=1 Tax=Sphingomonas sp. TaxID=28214 RepID=UPI00121A153D|nr:hypothetical protein [Sphingomonas sp.]THD35706.1 MAG: hypothetical protein E7773_10185 [Sphingomonas sp.]
MEITPEIQAAIDAAVAEATKKLNDKNAQLLSEKKKLAQEKTDAEAALEQATTEAAEKSGNIDTVKANLSKQHEAELTKLRNELATTSERLSSMTRETTLNEALTAANVLPSAMPLVKAFLASNAKFENGEWSVEGVSLRDHADTWLKSADAAHYVAAPANSGAGATGSTAKAGAQPIKSLDEVMKLAKENPSALASANLAPELEYIRKGLNP